MVSEGRHCLYQSRLELTSTPRPDTVPDDIDLTIADVGEWLEKMLGENE